MSDNSPLLEEATEKDGYFFRQYPLVNNGELVENAPKGKSIRKAICNLDGQVIVVMSDSRESFHDFAQALVDLKVSYAVYLVGSDSYGFYRDSTATPRIIYEPATNCSDFENYIIWKAE